MADKIKTRIIITETTDGRFEVIADKETGIVEVAETLAAALTSVMGKAANTLRDSEGSTVDDVKDDSYIEDMDEEFTLDELLGEELEMQLGGSFIFVPNLNKKEYKN